MVKKETKALPAIAHGGHRVVRYQGSHSAPARIRSIEKFNVLIGN
jgi:hypothetical protein